MATPTQEFQSATERRAAETELHTLIAKFAPTHLRLVNSARRSLRNRLPAAHEIVYEYRDCVVISISPSEHGYEGIFALRADADGVKFYFNRGKELQDPDKLLQGSGNQTRWIKLESTSTLARPPIARLVNDAIAHNRVPFANNDQRGGSLVIRSTAAKKRRTKRSAAPVKPAATVRKKKTTRRKVASRKKSV